MAVDVANPVPVVVPKRVEVAMKLASIFPVPIFVTTTIFDARDAELNVEVEIFVESAKYADVFPEPFCDVDAASAPVAISTTPLAVGLASTVPAAIELFT